MCVGGRGEEGKWVDHKKEIIVYSKMKFWYKYAETQRWPSTTKNVLQ